MQLPAGAANPITQPRRRGTLSDLYDDLAARAASREELFGQAHVESSKLSIHTKRVRDRTDASAALAPPVGTSRTIIRVALAPPVCGARAGPVADDNVGAADL